MTRYEITVDMESGLSIEAIEYIVQEQFPDADNVQVVGYDEESQ